MTHPTKRLVVIALAVALAVILSFPGLAGAADTKIRIPFAGPMYPEYGEALGLNMIVTSLQGITALNPDVKGAVDIQIYDKGALYPNMDEILEAVSSGAVEMSYSAPHYMEALNKAWALPETPGVVASWDQFLKAMETPAWKELHEEMAKKHNVTIVKWLFSVGDWVIFTNKGPAVTMADFQGQKIRYPGGEGFAKALKSLGIDGVALPYTEVVSALQTHMVDGVLTDLPSSPFYQMNRYCPFVNRIPLAIQPICWIASTSWWEGLDPKEREALMAPFERMELNPYYIRLQEAVAGAWDADPKLTVVPADAAEAAKWHQAMREAAKDVIDSVDPKYMEAIDSVK